MRAPSFFDTHCHLQDERFGAELCAVLERAQVAGITHLACCGTREADWGTILELSGRHGRIVPLLGLHPWFVRGASPGWLARLADLLEATAAGLGECGLDFAMEDQEDADRRLQAAAFQAQLELAHALNRPVSIHCRKAWGPLLAIARRTGLPEAGAVIHSYSGSAEMAHDLQALGFRLSFSCALANPANRRAAEAVRAVAEDRLLFETDAPDIPPRGVPGFDGARINEPANIRLVAEAAARLRQVPLDALSEQVYANSLGVLGGLAKGSPGGDP